MPDALRFLSDAEFKQAAQTDDTSNIGVMKGYAADEVRIVDEKKRQIDFVISTEDVDRMQDRIMVDGWQLANFRKNPVVLFAHDNRQPPIGRAIKVAKQTGEEKAPKSRKALVARAEFASREISEFADSIFQMFLHKFMRAVSVGFVPLDFKFVDDDENRPRGIDFMKQDLLEFSAVPVPANPQALVDAKSAGINLQPVRNWAERVLDEWTEYESDVGLVVPRKEIEVLYQDAEPKGRQYFKLNSEQKRKLRMENLRRMIKHEVEEELKGAVLEVDEGKADEVPATDRAANSEARTPDFSGTESSSWTAPTLQRFIRGYNKHSGADVDPGTDVADLPPTARNWIAGRSLLGNADANNFRDIRLFPVVNPNTNKLNENALRAVISGRGDQANISDEAKASAQAKARQLLEDRFGVEFDDEETSAEVFYEDDVGTLWRQADEHEWYKLIPCIVAEEDDWFGEDKQDEPFEIQTIIFPKSKWDSLDAAKKWAKDHGFKTSKVDTTSTSWRFRQREPDEFERLRTICINPGDVSAGSDKCRVKAVGGPRKSLDIDDSPEDASTDDEFGRAYGDELLDALNLAYRDEAGGVTDQLGLVINLLDGTMDAMDDEEVAKQAVATRSGRRQIALAVEALKDGAKTLEALLNTEDNDGSEGRETDTGETQEAVQEGKEETVDNQDVDIDLEIEDDVDKSTDEDTKSADVDDEDMDIDPEQVREMLKEIAGPMFKEALEAELKRRKGQLDD